MRNIEHRTDAHGIFVLEGEVGNMATLTPSTDPTDWTQETWMADGRYRPDEESIFDLVEVQS